MTNGDLLLLLLLMKIEMNYTDNDRCQSQNYREKWAVSEPNHQPL